MTVSESLIKWLNGFNPAEYWSMKRINTDMQAAEVDSYSLVKEPVQNVKAYMSGKKVYTSHYTIQARLSSNTNTDRVDNSGFGEALEDWVREKNSKKEFPALEDAAVQDIHITTPFCVGQTAEHNSVYQMTIAIKYEKENKT